jgi:hypothetical protein
MTFLLYLYTVFQLKNPYPFYHMNKLFTLAALATITAASFSSCSKSSDPAPVAADSAKVFTNTVLLAPLADNSSKTFIAFSTGATYTSTEAAASSASIDAGYFFGATAQAALASPSDYLTTAYDLSSWATKNETLFKTTSGVSYDNTATATQAKAAYDGGTATGQNGGGANAAKSTRIYTLTNGQIFAFKTASGKYGVGRVRAVTAGATGQIAIDYKVTK